ncbi:MAG: hypothetical protein WA138_04470 [Parvibaculum sp.]
MKQRLLYVLVNYPTLSQTYKDSEIGALHSDFEIEILTIGQSQAKYRQHYPFSAPQNQGEFETSIKRFKPDIVHGHYLHTADRLFAVSQIADCPFTLRTHSFDVLGPTPEQIKHYVKFLNTDRCLGILVFPFLANTLERLGVHHSKIVTDWPVVDLKRFHDESPNGKAIINTGACIPKKNMASFLELASRCPSRDFRLYPIGYLTSQIESLNVSKGNPVKIFPTVEPYEMPSVYKQCEWLIYTANPQVPTIGWPMAVAEAQASGCGVLMQKVRPDLDEYVGPGGYTFTTLDEALDILNRPYPETMRTSGFKWAEKSDIRKNIHRLTDLWTS